VAQIQQLRKMQVADGMEDMIDVDSDDDAGLLFYDNADLVDRIW